MFIHSATPRIGFVLLMCALLSFLLLACVTSPAPTAPPSTPTSPPPTPMEPPTSVPTKAPVKPTVAPSRTPGATPTKSGEAATPSGSTITFKDTLKAGSEDAFLVLGATSNIVQVSVKPASGLQVTLEFQKAADKKALFIAKSGKPLYAMVPETGLYRIVVRDAGKSGGDYSATFTGTKGIAFSLDPKFLITGRLSDDGSISHIYTGRPGSTLEGILAPHPDTKIDPIIKIHNLADVKNALVTINKADVGEEEKFTFTLPKSSNQADTFLIVVSEAKGNAGQYLLAIKAGN